MRKKHSYDLLSNYSWFVPDGGQVVILIALFFVGALIGSIVLAILTLCAGTDFASTYGTVITYPFYFIPIMIYASVKAKQNFLGTGLAIDNGNFQPFGGLKLALIVSALTLLIAFAGEPIVELLPEMPESLKQIFENLLKNTPLCVTLLSVSVLAPFFEEWLCRGMILRGLLRKCKPVWAIVISSLIFAFIHLNPWQAIPAFLLGMAFGYVYYRTGSLKLTMLMHCVNNTFSTIISNVYEDAETFSDLFPDKRAYVLMVVAATLLVILTIRLLKRVPLTGEKGSFEVLEGADLADVN